MKEDHEEQLQVLEQSYKHDIEELEAQHKANLTKLKDDFKAELIQTKTELENKLTEFRIEYEQRMTSTRHEDDELEEEDGEEGGDEGQRKVETKIENNDLQDDRNSHSGRNGRDGERISEEERKYDEILKELRERRKSLEEDLEELKTQENKVKEMKIQKLVPSASQCCSRSVCIHESKYNKLKSKYSTLVSRIKSAKAKKSSKKLHITHEGFIQNTPSLLSDRSSQESNANMSDSGQQSNDLTSSTSSPQHIQASRRHHHLRSISDASEDEDIRLATEVIEKYGSARNRSFSTSSLNNLKHRRAKHMTSIPKEAWMEDRLLTHGRKVLNKTEKFLKTGYVKSHYSDHDLRAEDIEREVLRQNTLFEYPTKKVKTLVNMFKIACHLLLMFTTVRIPQVHIDKRKA